MADFLSTISKKTDNFIEQIEDQNFLQVVNTGNTDHVITPT